MSTPIETAERTRRELVSSVKRLRVLATSDPARGDELADALVLVTGERLRCLDFAAAAADAPEAVLLAARILARNGAAGPYTSPADATRFFTASALLAATQCGLGQEAAAGRTLAGVDGWMQQLGRLPLRDHLEPAAVIWSLVARARSLLATDAALANAYAEAAAQRLYAAGLDSAQDYLAVTVQQLLADCRWAAGLTDQALGHHRLALAGYRMAVGDVTGRVRPGVAQVALAPVVGLHEPYALRLEYLGQPGFAVAIRRAEVARLEELGAAAAVLGNARARLAGALGRQGRSEEAQAELAEAVVLDPSWAGSPHVPAAAPRGPASWEALSPTQALAPEAHPEAAILRLQQDLQTAVLDGPAARLDAERAEDLLRQEAETAAADRAADRAEAERLAQAESEAARAAAGEQDRKEAEQSAARRDTEEAAARAAAHERRQQLADEHQRRLVVDPATAAAAAAELTAARARVRDAAGELRSLRDAQERLVGLLRPLALVDPGAHRAELVAGLEALVGLRWRLGDPDGSREAAREARGQAAEPGQMPA
ncbi:MAG: hypothetical protein ACOH1Y_13220 [Propionicimonas sp.]